MNYYNEAPVQRHISAGDGQRKLITLFIGIAWPILVGWLGMTDLLKEYPTLEFWFLAATGVVAALALAYLRDHDSVVVGLHDGVQAGVAILLGVVIAVALVLHVGFGKSVGEIKAIFRLSKSAAVATSERPKPQGTNGGGSPSQPSAQPAQQGQSSSPPPPSGPAPRNKDNKKAPDLPNDGFKKNRPMP